MKKIIALVLALCMVLSACVALADETEGLKDARSYINLMYKKKPASTPKDYELIGSVPGDSETYTVEWTTDSDTITVTRLDSGMVKIDVDENNPKEVAYKLTATIKDAAGNETSISFDRFVPAAINLDVMTEEEIVEVAYTLDDGAALPTATVLTGTIVAIPSAYSDQYDNITVNIQVGDLADKPIQCYRLMGGSSLQIGDEITVLGTIKNYKGTIEFDKDCYIIDPEYAQSARVVLFAYSLEDGAALSHASTVTGVILSIPSAYSADYGNITVNIGVPGLYETPIQCYRLNGGEDLAEGDIITVTGTIKNYKGTIEFDKGCTYVKVVSEQEAEELAAIPEDAADVLGSEDADLETLLVGFLGLLAGEGDGEADADADQLLGELSGLFGSLTDETAKVEESGDDGAFMNELLQLFGGLTDEPTNGGESGDDGAFMNELLQLFGGLTDETAKVEESGDDGAFMNELLQLFGGLTDEPTKGGETGEGDNSELMNTILQLLGGMTNETGEGEDASFLNMLLQLFGELGETSGTETRQISDEELEALLTQLFSLFTKE